MLVYPSEVKAGLQDLILPGSVAFTTEPRIVDQPEDLEEVLKALGQANPNQFDLFYLEPILASVGWNDNDDVFDPDEIWAAKDTPVDKQFNFMHNEKDIIGHLTSTKIIAESKIITEKEDLPDNFDIVVGAVLYRRWSDKDLQARMDQLIAEIKEAEDAKAAKWFVSMECLFKNFDYALVTPEGEQKVVARNEKTAFLTKYLRAYKGVGEFQGNKIGRLIRSFAFSGMGLVDNPANKRSIILNFSETGVETEFTACAEEKVMSYTEQQYKDLEVKLAEAEKRAKEAIESVTAKQLDEYKGQIATLQAELEAAKQSIAEKEKNMQDKKAMDEECDKEKEKKTKALEDENTQLKAKVEELTKAVKEYEVAKAQAERLAKLSKTDVTEERAKALVDKFSNVSDELFDELVKSLPAKAEKTKTEETVEESEQSTAEVIDDIEIEDEPAMSVASTDEAKELRTAASAWLSDILKNKEQK